MSQLNKIQRRKLACIKVKAQLLQAKALFEETTKVETIEHDLDLKLVLRKAPQKN